MYLKTPKAKTPMQKWKYGTLYSVECFVDDVKTYFYAAIESNDSRIISKGGQLAAMDILGAEGWIISDDNLTQDIQVHSNDWRRDLIRKSTPGVVSDFMMIRGRYFMRRPVGDI